VDQNLERIARGCRGPSRMPAKEQIAVVILFYGKGLNAWRSISSLCSALCLLSCALVFKD